MYLEGSLTLKNESKVSIRELLVQLFETTRSSHVCVILDKDELTISTLSLRAHRIGLLMKNESCVAICIDLSLELIIVLCGVPYVPLEPRLPDERLTHMFSMIVKHQ
jgi:non-ribosomal peptide synthetase component F